MNIIIVLYIIKTELAQTPAYPLQLWYTMVIINYSFIWNLSFFPARTWV